MIQNDEAPSSLPATDIETACCLKCGTSYSNKVEFVQHLLLHIERTYPVVTLDRDEVDNYEGVPHIQHKMSEEGEAEMTQTEEVETKPKLNNNFESHADSNNLSSAKDGDRRESVSADDDSMSICSSIVSPTRAIQEAPKMVVKAEVHAPDAEPAPTEANGRRSSESSLGGKDQSGAEDEDDGKNSEGSKSPAKPTTPSLPFCATITVRKSEDLMAQKNYNFIQKRLQDLYARCQGTTLQENRPAGSNLGTASAASVSGSGSRNKLEGDQTVQLAQGHQASSGQSAAVAAHPLITTNETQDDHDDVTPVLSECQSENSDEAHLTPAINAEIDAVLEGIDFSRIPDQIDGGIDSDNGMGLQISPTDCDWLDDNDKKHSSPEFSENAIEDEPNPPPAPQLKKVGPKPKISDYFSVTRKSTSNSNSIPDITQLPKTQPRIVLAESSKEEVKLMHCAENEGDGSNHVSSTAKSCGKIVKGSNLETMSKNVMPSKRYTSFKGVLNDENGKDDLDEREFGLNRDKSIPVKNVERVPTESTRNSPPFLKKVSADGGFRDARTIGATPISMKSRTDSFAVEGPSCERNMLQNFQMGKRPTYKRSEDLKPVMTERCGSDRRTTGKFGGVPTLKPILTDTGGRTVGNRDAAGRFVGNRGQTSKDILNPAHNRPRFSKAPKDPYSDKDSLSDHADKSSQPFQTCGTGVDATYAQVVRNLSNEISLSVTPAESKRRTSSEEMGKKVPVNQGKTKTSADCNQKSSFGHDEESVGKSQSNKRGIDSGRKVLTRSQSCASDARDGSNLIKESASNLTTGDGQSQVDNSLDVRNLGHGISVSVAPSGKKQRASSEEMGKQVPVNYGKIAGDGDPMSRFELDEKPCGKAQSNREIDCGRKVQTRRQSHAGNARGDPSRKESTSGPAGGDGQMDSSAGDARYDLGMQNLGHGISMSVMPSIKKHRTSSEGQCKTSANINPSYGDDEENVSKAQNGKGEIDSGRKDQARPASFANVRHGLSLIKESTSNPTGGDGHIQTDSSNMDARYDRDVHNLGHGVSLSLSQFEDCQTDQGINQRLVPARSSNLKGSGVNLGQDEVHKGEITYESVALPRPQSSTDANLTSDLNPNKGSFVNPIDKGGNQTQLDIAAAMTAYNPSIRNLVHEITMSLDPALNSEHLTDQEIDDLILSTLRRRSGMVISKAVPNQQPSSQSNSTDLNEKTNMDSVQEQHGHKSSVERRHTVDGKRRQPNKPRVGSQSKDVTQQKDSERSKKKVLRPRKKPAPHYVDEDEGSAFEAQCAPDSSSDAGSQTVKSTTSLNNPQPGTSCTQESKGSDSDLLDIKIPELPPFFEAFPSAPASVVGMKFSETAIKDGGHRPASQDGNTAIPGPSRPRAGTPKGAPFMKHQLPLLAPTPTTGPRFAVPIQRPNKPDDDVFTSKALATHTQPASDNGLLHKTNLKKKSLTILPDSDSSGTFEVKRKPKSADQKSDRLTSVEAIKDIEEAKPQDFMQGLFTGLSPPKPLTPVCVTTAGTLTPGKSYTNLQPLESSFYQDPSENPSHPFPSQVTLVTSPEDEYPNGDFQGSQKDLYRCALCPRSFVTAAELDAHAAAEGHIICSMSEACASLSFDSQGALSHHQAMVHQAPTQTTAVQRLAAQVERLPQTFGGYPPQVPPQSYGAPPSYSLPQTSYNGPKLGSQVVLTPMSAAVAPPPLHPPPNLPNLPGIQVTKRPAPPPVESSPSKINRIDDGLPSIRLPDSITLVKSQPAPPPQNAVADMLATRGITMVASGSRAGPTQATSIQPVAPPKRLPNVPSAISIVPSRAQPAQRFAVPPAPQQRGRPVANLLGTVDLTRDEQNGRMRAGRPLGVSSSPRRFSCTICDKVYPTAESLQAHMAVHGSNKPGRYMCEICRVVYTNEAKLQHHKKTVHAVRAAPDTEMVIPICDLNQPGVKEKLLQCGIRHVIQVQSIRNANDTAAFGLPIIPIDLARNEAYSRLDDLGASNILSLGSLRNIYR